MKTYFKALLYSIALLSITLPAQGADFWPIVRKSIHTNIGCKDTFRLYLSSPIPALENSRGKVVEVGEWMQLEDTDLSDPQYITPHPDADVWLSEDSLVIYVVIRNLKIKDDYTSDKRIDSTGPFYSIKIIDRFSPKKDNKPDEVVYEEHDFRYNIAYVRYQAGVEEDTHMMLREKVGDDWFAPYYPRAYSGHTVGDTIFDKVDGWVDVETKYYEYCEAFFGDRKFLRWEKEGKQIDDIEFGNPYPNRLDYTIRCGAITGGWDLTITPIYSKPIPRWNLTITIDSTIKSLDGIHYYPWQQWDTTNTWGSTEIHVETDNDTTLNFSILKDSADFFYVSWAKAAGEYWGTPLRMISNIPEFNKQSARYSDSTRWPDLYEPSIYYQKIYYHPGYDSVHIHFTRAKEVVSVEEEMPEAGIQPLAWQTTSNHDILLKTPSLWGEGQVELYTILGTMVQQFDVNTLSRSSEGMLLPTAGIPSGAYIVLVKSKNYRSGTVLQIIH